MSASLVGSEMCIRDSLSIALHIARASLAVAGAGRRHNFDHRRAPRPRELDLKHLLAGGAARSRRFGPTAAAAASAPASMP
eukprot:14306554-Alexandrium_andersonii.AAC.1